MVDVQNYADPAYQSFLLIRNSPGVAYVGLGVNSGDEAQRCTFAGENFVQCELNNPFKGQAVFDIRYGPVYLKTTNINMSVWVNTSSVLIEPAEVQHLQFKVVR